MIIVANGEIASSSLPSTHLKLKITATLTCIFGLRLDESKLPNGGYLWNWCVPLCIEERRLILVDRGLSCHSRILACLRVEHGYVTLVELN